MISSKKYKSFSFGNSPPSYDAILNTSKNYGLNNHPNKGLFCSDENDIPEKIMEVGGDVLKIPSNSILQLDEYSGGFQNEGLYQWQGLLSAVRTNETFITDGETSISPKMVTFTTLQKPPSFVEVEKWAYTRNVLMNLQKNARNTKGESEKSDNETKAHSQLQSVSHDISTHVDPKIISGSRSQEVKKALITTVEQKETSAYSPMSSFVSSTPLGHRICEQRRNMSKFEKAFSSVVHEPKPEKSEDTLENVTSKLPSTVKKRKTPDSSAPQYRPIKRRVSFFEDVCSSPTAGLADVIPLSIDPQFTGTAHHRAKFAGLQLTAEESTLAKHSGNVRPTEPRGAASLLPETNFTEGKKLIHYCIDLSYIFVLFIFVLYL